VYSIIDFLAMDREIELLNPKAIKAPHTLLTLMAERPGKL
jgi:hypothetical protein